MGSLFTIVGNQAKSSDMGGQMMGLYGEKKSFGEAFMGKIAADDLFGPFKAKTPDAPAADTPAAATPVQASPQAQAAVAEVAAKSQPAGANLSIGRRFAQRQATKRGRANTILTTDTEELG